MSVKAALKRCGEWVAVAIRPLWMLIRPVALPVWNAVRLTVSGLGDKNADLMAAGLGFYALISIAPLLVIAVAVGGAIVGPDLVLAEVHARMVEQVGAQMADFISSLAVTTRPSTGGIIATILSVVALLLASSRLFGTLTSAINALWSVTEDRKSNVGAVVWRFIRGKLMSMGGVITIGVVFIGLMAVRFTLTFAQAFSEDVELLEVISFWAYIEFVVALAVLTVLFAVVFRVLPDRKLRWTPIWIGAAITAILMLIGRALISRYLGTASIESAYGAAGSVVVFLFWAYYSAIAFLFGAQLTHVIATGQYRAAQGSLAV